MGKCWKLSAALNLKIDSRSSSVSAGSQGSELGTGDKSGVPLMQVSYEVESACGSNTAELIAPVMGLSLPSSDDLICSRSKARVVTGAISWMRPDDRFKPCLSGRRGAVTVVSNQSKIKSPRMSAT